MTANKREALVIAKLLVGEAVTVDLSSLADPWGWIAQRLVDVQPNRRGDEFEKLVAQANGQADEIRHAVLAADPGDDLARFGVDPLEADNGYLPVDLLVKAMPRGETGDAEILRALYADRIIYDHSAQTWHKWSGNYWEPDTTNQVRTLVANHVAAQYLHSAAELRKQGTKEAALLSEQMMNRAAQLCNRRRIDNVLSLAASLPSLATAGDSWDSNPWLLAVANGVIDLRTGSFERGRPADYIRAHSPTMWTGLDTPCPTWERAVLEIFGGDDSLVTFIQRLLGYGITGLTVEHVLPILYGPGGRNGKTTLLETLGDVLGKDLATSSQADALMDARISGEGPKPFVYALRGKRLVWASESNEGRRINAGLVKQLTGGDRLNVRTLHSKPVEFTPSHLLLLLTNHSPHIPAEDDAIWERVFRIPFNIRFVDRPAGANERKKNSRIREALAAERSGILAWLVRGCLVWQRDGLNPPEAIKASTEQYREEEDTVGAFLEERCVIRAGVEVRASAIYVAYTEWCKEYGEKAMSNTAFGKRMKRRFQTKKSNGVWYVGVGLLAD